MIAQCLKCGMVLRHNFYDDVQCCTCGNVRVSKNGVEAKATGKVKSNENVTVMKDKGVTSWVKLCVRGVERQ